MAHHMPIFIEWQAELFMYKMLSTGEIRGLLQQAERSTNVAEGIRIAIEKLPHDINGLMKQNQQDLQQMANTLEAASRNLRKITEQVSPLFLKQDNNSDGETDLLQIQKILEVAYATSSSTLNALETFSSLSYDPDTTNHYATLMSAKVKEADTLMEHRMKQIDRLLLNHRQDTFIMLVTLCFLFPAIFFTGYVIAKRIVDKHQFRLAGAEGNQPPSLPKT